MTHPLIQTDGYKHLLTNISGIFTNANTQAARTINTQLLKTYWRIGQYIVEFEQGGNAKAVFGKALLENLANDLTTRHGRGFSRSNLNYMRLFYVRYPICEKASHKLSWSHYVELLKIDNELERSFYENQIIPENWSVPELRRQKKTALFLRLAASKDKEGGCAKTGARRSVHSKTSRSASGTYILDFLKIPEPYRLSENDLEARIKENLQHFLLELGKGFAFIGRQYRITLANRHHYVDLVFYHRILKCFVLIDLKKEDAGYHDIGQMNMYLGYFENEENREDDNPPIGIVLAREKDELQIKYAMHNISDAINSRKDLYFFPATYNFGIHKKLFPAKTQLYGTLCRTTLLV